MIFVLSDLAALIDFTVDFETLRAMLCSYLKYKYSGISSGSQY